MCLLLFFDVRASWKAPITTMADIADPAKLPGLGAL